jgi:hypothetical protein
VNYDKEASMAVTLDHTIVHLSDNLTSTDNDVALDFMTARKVFPHHYAFTVTPAEFDAAYGRVRTQGLTIYARPDRSGESKYTSATGGEASTSTIPTGT